MKNIRPVKTERDYDYALARIEELWGAKAGTTKGDELDIYLTLVEAYEDKHHPVPPPDPIEAIKFVMDQKGLKQIDMVPYIGSRSKVSEVLNRKRPLTLSMIRALVNAFDIPADVLVQDNMSFTEEDEGMDWSRFPTRELVKRGVVSGYDPKSQAEEIMRWIIQKLGISKTSPYSMAACFRQGSRRNDKDDPYAIQAWIYQVLLEAQQLELANKPYAKSYDPETLRIVARLSVLSEGPVMAREYLATKGIKMVVVPHYKRTYLDGAALYGVDGWPIVALTIRYDRIDNFWFTLLHELAHLFLGHLSESGNNCIIDDLDLKASLDKAELEADQAANEALIPEKLWESHPARRTGRLAQVKELANMADVHPAVVAGRVRFEKNDYRILSRQVGNKEVGKQFFS